MTSFTCGGPPGPQSFRPLQYSKRETLKLLLRSTCMSYDFSLLSVCKSIFFSSLKAWNQKNKGHWTLNNRPALVTDHPRLWIFVCAFVVVFHLNSHRYTHTLPTAGLHSDRQQVRPGFTSCIIDVQMYAVDSWCRKSYPVCIAHLTFTALISAVNSQQDKTGVFNNHTLLTTAKSIFISRCILGAGFFLFLDHDRSLMTDFSELCQNSVPLNTIWKFQAWPNGFILWVALYCLQRRTHVVTCEYF